MVREVEVKHRGEKKVQTSTCSSSGLDEMVRQAKGRELVNDSPNELQAAIWAGWGGKGEVKVVKEHWRYKKKPKERLELIWGPWDLWPSQTSSWWLVWTQMSLSPPQISCWSSSGGIWNCGKSRNAPVQYIAQNGNPNRAWAAQGGLGSPYLGSWTTLDHEPKHWLSWLLASARLNGFWLEAALVAPQSGFHQNGEKWTVERQVSLF